MKRKLLLVSHHAEDAPACITHRLEFVPDGGLGEEEDRDAVVEEPRTPRLPFPALAAVDGEGVHEQAHAAGFATQFRW